MTNTLGNEPSAPPAGPIAAAAAPPAGPIADDPETIRRKIAEWLIAGMRISEIPKYAAKERWTLGAEQLREAIDAATALVTADAAGDKDHRVRVAILRLEQIYANAMRIHDFKTALNAQREQNKLLKLTEHAKTADLDEDDDKLAEILAQALAAQPKKKSNGRRKTT